MMAKFMASNGVKVYKDIFGEIKTDASELFIAMPGAISKAISEFVLHERDRKLGRWRSKERPDYVVYPLSENVVRVICELTGDALGVSRGEREPWGNPDERVEVFNSVGDEYFEYHPEPKPWHDAQEGEVWLITASNPSQTERLGEYPAIFQAHRFRDHGGSWGVRDIIAARRIWPEVEEES